MKWSEGFSSGNKVNKYPTSLKLPVGSSVVEILGEPEEVEQEDIEDKQKMVTKLIFPVRYQEQVFSWWITKGYVNTIDGKPKSTLFSQLARLDQANNGLVGAVLKVTAVGDAKGRRYLVELK